MNYRKHKMYSVYHCMVQRCTNVKNKDYKNYGARGIKVLFLNAKEFIDWGLLNGYEKGLEIDRKNNDGNYEANNCRFVTKSINNMNRRCTSSSGYYGVSYQKTKNIYKARLGNKSIGYTKTALEAATLYNEYIINNQLSNKLNVLVAIQSETQNNTSRLLKSKRDSKLYRTR